MHISKSGMLKAKYIVYPCLNINMSHICQNNTANHLKFGE